GFDLGFAIAAGETTDIPVTVTSPTPARAQPTAKILAMMENAFPPDVHEVLRRGMERLIDFQDDTYAQAYLDRLQSVLETDRGNGGENRGYALTRDTARWLVRLMAYDDIIRVADLKTR
ncbi:MAG TPA: hypothetical protein DG414_08835, partial [Gammaproteobacteria bacterium]|nr:hypothetical protein [Gammaproteobacteria bacterium]